MLPVKDLPEIAADLVKQMQEIANKFTGTQQTLTDNGFSFLRQIDFKDLPLAITKEE